MSAAQEHPAEALPCSCGPQPAPLAVIPSLVS
jgi:hypothetical protein